MDWRTTKKIVSRGKISVPTLISGLVLTLFFGAYLYMTRFVEPSPAERNLSQYQVLEGEWRNKFRKSAEGAYAEFLRTGSKLSYADSHKLSHVVGDILYERFGVNGIARCTQDFAYGCYHGFAGTALADRGLSSVASLRNGCNSAGDSRVSFGCIHGIGHGILAYVGNEELSQALEICNPLNNGISDIGGCYGGVIMEYNYNTMRSPKGIELRPFDMSGAYEPCESGVAEKFKRACYYEQPSWWRASLGGDRVSMPEQFGEVGKLCAGVKDTSLRGICFRGVGNVIGPRSEYQADVMRKWCSSMPSAESRDFCFHEALNHLLQGDNGKTQLRALCAAKEILYDDLCRPDL